MLNDLTSTSKKFRTLTRDGTYLSGGSQVGIFREGGVPNFKGQGSLLTFYSNLSGPFYRISRDSTYGGVGGSNYDRDVVGFDPSRSKKVYQDNVDKVLTDAYNIEYWIKYKRS